MKIWVFDIFEKGQILRPFSGLAPSKLKIKKKNNGSICAYIVFYLPNFRRTEGGGVLTAPKKRSPERVKKLTKTLIMGYKFNLNS